MSPSVPLSIPDLDPFTFDKKTGDYKIVRQLRCRSDKVAVEVEGKNVVRITTSEWGGMAHEVLMPGDVKLEKTTAAFDGGALVVTVPKRAGWFAGCPCSGVD